MAGLVCRPRDSTWCPLESTAETRFVASACFPLRRPSILLWLDAWSSSNRPRPDDVCVQRRLHIEMPQHVVLVDVVLLVVAVGGWNPERGDAERLGEHPERQCAAQRGQRHRLGVAVLLEQA